MENRPSPVETLTTKVSVARRSPPPRTARRWPVRAIAGVDPVGGRVDCRGQGEGARREHRPRQWWRGIQTFGRCTVSYNTANDNEANGDLRRGLSRHAQRRGEQRQPRLPGALSGRPHVQQLVGGIPGVQRSGRRRQGHGPVLICRYARGDVYSTYAHRFCRAHRTPGAGRQDPAGPAPDDARSTSPRRATQRGARAPPCRWISTTRPRLPWRSSGRSPPGGLTPRSTVGSPWPRMASRARLAMQTSRSSGSVEPLPRRLFATSAFGRSWRSTACRSGACSSAGSRSQREVAGPGSTCWIWSNLDRRDSPRLLSSEPSPRPCAVRPSASEDFMLFKLLSARDRDLEDAISLLRAPDLPLDMSFVGAEAVRLGAEISDHDLAGRLARLQAPS